MATRLLSFTTLFICSRADGNAPSYLHTIFYSLKGSWGGSILPSQHFLFAQGLMATRHLTFTLFFIRSRADGAAPSYLHAIFYSLKGSWGNAILPSRYFLFAQGQMATHHLTFTLFFICSRADGNAPSYFHTIFYLLKGRWDSAILPSRYFLFAQGQMATRHLTFTLFFIRSRAVEAAPSYLHTFFYSLKGRWGGSILPSRYFLFAQGLMATRHLTFTTLFICSRADGTAPSYLHAIFYLLKGRWQRAILPSHFFLFAQGQLGQRHLTFTTLFICSRAVGAAPSFLHTSFSTLKGR
ncbi:hypothetical protein [Evansella cellulosilytica]|uniref:Uncharacterized protein n=1 Tax=Evansella cellulosilytica (strain ATCC 21833 / DSM 2522 / FERM P-1141 / JCM 9156 / N-4) TaxID=649639 RepID=E6TZ19_EVAC2|nr:hypothetical protein [Evansella cellulosilytica]ADU32462.1 hypothetical protein Bcell_4235 [Evansella cellulosilytica DSM 2522]